MRKFAIAKIGAALALATLTSACLTVFPDPAPAPQIFRLDAPDYAFQNAPKVGVDDLDRAAIRAAHLVGR